MTTTTDLKLTSGMKFITPSDGNAWSILNIYRDSKRGQVITLQCSTCISQEPFNMDQEVFLAKLGRSIFILQP